MAVTPIVTGEFQEYFFPMFDEGQDTTSTSGVNITAWEDIPLLANSIYRLQVVGAFTGTILTTMQLAFNLGHTPDTFAVACMIAHSAADVLTRNLNAANTFTNNIVPLTAAITLPFRCIGTFTTGEDESTLTARFRTMLLANSVEILPGSMLSLTCLRKPIP